MRPCVHFLFQVFDVGLQVRRFGVFFGITRHADAEIGRGRMLHFARKVFAPVHSRYLRHQFTGVEVSAGMRTESMLAAYIVAPQSQHVVDAQEIHLDQGVFGLVGRKTAADQVRDHIDAVPGGDGR